MSLLLIASLVTESFTTTELNGKSIGFFKIRLSSTAIWNAGRKIPRTDRIEANFLPSSCSFKKNNFTSDMVTSPIFLLLKEYLFSNCSAVLCPAWVVFSGIHRGFLYNVLLTPLPSYFPVGSPGTAAVAVPFPVPVMICTAFFQLAICHAVLVSRNTDFSVFRLHNNCSGISHPGPDFHHCAKYVLYYPFFLCYHFSYQNTPFQK